MHMPPEPRHVDPVEDAERVPRGVFGLRAVVEPVFIGVVEQADLALELGARARDDFIEVLALAQFEELRPVPPFPFPIHGGVEDVRLSAWVTYTLVSGGTRSFARVRTRNRCNTGVMRGLAVVNSTLIWAYRRLNDRPSRVLSSVAPAPRGS